MPPPQEPTTHRRGDGEDRARKPKPDRARPGGSGQMADITRDDVTRPTADPGTVSPGGNMEKAGEHEQWWQQNEGKFGQQGLGDKFFQRTNEGYSQEGLGEKFASDNAGMLQSMGQGEQWWNKYGGGFNQASASEGLQQDPGLGSYYDRAKDRTAGSINDQLAARGSFGSSAGMGQISDAMVGLEAERANREGDYRAQVAGQADEARMARMGLGGALSGQAQMQEQGRISQGMGMQSQAQNQMLDRLTAGQNAASSADNFGLNQLIAGGNASMGVQQTRQNRVQQGFDNRIRTSDIAAGIIGGGMQNIAGNDQKLFEAANALGLGGAMQNVNAQQLNAAIASGNQDAIFALLGEAAGQAGNAVGAIADAGGGQSRPDPGLAPGAEPWRNFTESGGSGLRGGGGGYNPDRYGGH